MQIFPYKLLAAGLLIHKLLRTYIPPNHNKVVQPVRRQQWGSTAVIYQAGEGEKPKGPLLF